MNLLIAILATLRLTRFVTTDTLGEWLFVGKAKAWAGRYEQLEILQRITAEEYRRDNDPKVKPENHRYMTHDGREITAAEFVTQDYDPHDPWTWQAKLVKGLDCPFCVGFWIGAGVLLSLAIARAVPPLLPLWRLALGAFALNYVTGHVSARIDG